MKKWLYNLLKINEIDIDDYKTIASDQISTINIDSSFMDVNVLPSDDENMHIRYYVNGKSNLTEKRFFSLFKIERDENTLHISLADVDIFIMKGEWFITVELPVRMHALLSHKSSSGDLKVKGQFAELFEVKTASGNVVLEEMKVENLQLKTKSGNIKINQLHVHHEMEIDTLSGNVLMRGAKARKAKFNTNSGEINLKDSSIEVLKAEALSGDIRSNMLHVNSEIKAKTTSGDISLKLKDTNEYYAKTTTLSGDVRASGNQSPNGIKVFADTLSGDIFIQN